MRYAVGVLDTLLWLGQVLLELLGACALLAVVIGWLDKRPGRREGPPGYVGRFRRPDGLTVHVYRSGGQLTVASDEPVGVFPTSLGLVSGRELATWEKLAARPD